MPKSRTSLLLAAIVVAVIAMALPLAGVRSSIFTAIIGIPLVLVLPGYALVEAAFPHRGLRVPERVAFTIGFSLTIAILGGLALNLAPFGLQPISWSILLGGATIVLGGFALAQRRVDIESIRPAGHVPVLPALVLGLAGIVIVAAVMVARSAAQQQQQAEGVTRLWMLPENNEIHLGIDNLRPSDVDYRLQVTANGKPIKEWSDIGLKSQANWQTTIALPANTSTQSTLVVANLYFVGKPSVIYRHVELWVGKSP